jgi:predicted HAD superfamily hydrolase
LLDKEFSKDLGKFLRFSTLRNSLFSGMRHRDRKLGCELEEYPLSALYEYAAETYNLSRELTSRMMKAELKLDEDLLQPRHTGMMLYELAGFFGKRVVIASDTFLTTQELYDLIAPMLPYAPEEIFSSLDLGVTKHSGNLFDCLLEDLGISAKKIVHIGDNMVSDVKNAGLKGIKGHHFPSYMEVFHKHALGSVWHQQRLEAGTSLSLGLFAGRFFDNPFALHAKESYFDASPYWLGYAAVGPLMLEWVRWTLSESLARGNDKVMFVARDGWVPLQIAHSLQKAVPEYQAIECTYVFASRKAYMPLYQESAADVAFTRFAHGLDPNTTSVNRALRTRFGNIALEKFAETFLQAGFNDLDAPIEPRRAELFIQTLAALAPQIVKLQEGARETARNYFVQEIGNSKAPAIFDIGYSGSSQRAFMLASDRNVDGYYLTIMEHNVEYSDMLGYSANDFTGESAFFKNGAFVEYLITPCGLPECVSYRTKKDGKVVPHFGAKKGYDTVNSDVHRGIQHYLEDFLETFDGYVGSTKQRPAHAARMLANFLTKPKKGDVQVFDRLEHEDEIGAGRPNLLDYWHDGKQALKC